jgi:putative ABC transport system permease protein
VVGLAALDRKLLRDLWHLRGQMLAIALVLASGIATFVLSVSTRDSLEYTQQRFYQDSAFGDIFAGLTRAPEQLVPRIRAIPGVNRVETRVNALVNLVIPGFPDPANAQLISLPDGRQPSINRLFVKSGRLPGPTSQDEALVSEAFAAAHGLGPGDHLQIIVNNRLRDLVICGTALSPEFVYQIRPGDFMPDFKRYAIIWMNRRSLGQTLDMEGAFNGITLSVAPDASRPEIIQRLDALLAPYGGTGAITRADQLSHRYLTEELKQIRVTATIVPLIFLGVAAFLVNIVVGRLVQQQRDQIGVLKAFGYENRVIAWHFAKLVLAVVVAGSVIGLLAGAWLGSGLANLYSDFFRYPYLDYIVRPPMVLTAVLIGTAAALGGGLSAVRSAAALPPAEAMRAEPPARYSATPLERLGVGRAYDQPTRMIARHLMHHPGRTALAMLGIALSVGILLVGRFQQDAVNFMVNAQFKAAQREDLTITFSEPSSYRAAHDLRHLQGVRAVEPFRTVAVRLVSGHRKKRTALEGIDSQGRLHRLLDTDLNRIPLPTRGIVLEAYLARSLHVGLGDDIEVDVLEGRRPNLTLRVTGIANAYLGTGAYMPRASLNRLLNEDDVISGAWLQVEHQHERALFDYLKRTPRVAGVGMREVMMRSFEDTMGENLLIFAMVNILLAGTIATGVVYNTVRIAFAERSRELASLRVLGFTRSEVAYILFGELTIILALGIPGGFWAGRALCGLLAANLQSELYRVPLILEPSSYAFAATVVLLASLGAALVIRGHLNRMDLVAVLKTRE